jgi:hypothetical protein
LNEIVVETVEAYSPNVAVVVSTIRPRAGKARCGTTYAERLKGEKREMMKSRE